MRKQLVLKFVGIAFLGISTQSHANGSVYGNVGYFEYPWSILIGYSDYEHGYGRPRHTERHHYYHKPKRHHYNKPHRYNRGHNYGHYKRHDYYKPHHYRGRNKHYGHDRRYRHRSHYNNEGRGHRRSDQERNRGGRDGDGRNRDGRNGEVGNRRNRR